MEKEKLLKVGEVAEILGVTEQSIYRMVKEKRIINLKLSNKILRFRESDIIDFIRNSVRAAKSI
mgnify:FL=1